MSGARRGADSHRRNYGDNRIVRVVNLHDMSGDLGHDRPVIRSLRGPPDFEEVERMYVSCAEQEFYGRGDYRNGKVSS